MITGKGLTTAGVVLAMAAMSWWLRAAPIIGARPMLPDEILTLQGLRDVRLKTAPVTPTLLEHGITMEMLQAFRQRLAERGFELTEKQDVPIIQFSARVQTNARHPRIVAIYFVVDVHQRVRLHRIDRDLSVPTISVSHAAITTRDQVESILEQEVRDLADRFLKFLDLANM